MEKNLIGSLVILGAGAFAGQAAAQEMELNLSGFYVGALGYIDEDLGSSSRDYATGSDSEIHIDASTILDNGVEIGFHAEAKLEEDSASNDGDFVEEKFIYFKGVWGLLEFGDQDGIADQMAIYAPSLFRGNTVNDAELSLSSLNSINTVTTIWNGGDDFATKINYFTPRVVGFQAGVSFTPDQDQGGSNFDSLFDTLYDESIEFGVTYMGELTDDVNIGASTTYLTADSGSTSLDPQSYSVGVNIATGGFTFGGSFKESEDLTSDLAMAGMANEYTAWDIGGIYETGAWGFQLTYAEDETEVAGVTVSETSAVQVAVDYMIGRGISVGGGLQFIEMDTPLYSEDATVVFAETQVDF